MTDMDLSVTFLICMTLFIGTYSFDIDFCSGTSESRIYGIKDMALTIEGSPARVSKYVTSGLFTSCSCSILPMSAVNRFHLTLRSTILSDLHTCNRELDIISGDDDVQRLRCENGSVELTGDDSARELDLVFYLDGTRSTDSGQYIVVVETEPDSSLAVKCSGPVYMSTTNITATSTTSQSNAISSTTSSHIEATSLGASSQLEATPRTASEGPVSTTKSSRPTLVEPESSDTTVIVIVVVGLGLFFLVAITCLLCYIARRKKRHSSDDKSKEQSSQGVYQQNRFRRTLTHFYAKLKNNRPLPKIPESSIMGKRPVEHVESGHYASIRSNADGSMKHIANKQDSVQSDDTYLEPVTLSSVSEDETTSNGNRPKTTGSPGITKDLSLDYLHLTYVTTAHGAITDKVITNASHHLISKEPSTESTGPYLEPLQINSLKDSNETQYSQYKQTSGINKQMFVAANGYYPAAAQIKSTYELSNKTESPKVTKQLSTEPTDPYIHPTEHIGIKKDTQKTEVFDKFRPQSITKDASFESNDSYLHPAKFVDTRESKINFSRPDSLNSTNVSIDESLDAIDSYLHPFEFLSTEEDTADKMPYVNVPGDHASTESNANTIENNANDKADHDKVIKYGNMKSRQDRDLCNESHSDANKCVVQTPDPSETGDVNDTDNKELSAIKSKPPVVETDSGGYIKMNGKRPSLVTQDSIFPNLLNFKLLGDDSTSLQNSEENFAVKSAVKKPRRYVRSAADT